MREWETHFLRWYLKSKGNNNGQSRRCLSSSVLLQRNEVIDGQRSRATARCVLASIYEYDTLISYRWCPFSNKVSIPAEYAKMRAMMQTRHAQIRAASNARVFKTTDLCVSFRVYFLFRLFFHYFVHVSFFLSFSTKEYADSGEIVEHLILGRTRFQLANHCLFQMMVWIRIILSAELFSGRSGEIRPYLAGTSSYSKVSFILRPELSR